MELSCRRKVLALLVLVESSYEKDVVFYFSLGEPRRVKDGNNAAPDGADLDLEDLSMRAYSQLTDQQRTAIKGRPQLGEVTSTQIRLKESKEFKVGNRQLELIIYY